MLKANKSGGASTNSLPAPVRPRVETAFAEPRNFLGNRFIYVVISQRARGLSVGVNMNPDQTCNFNCVYCEVKRNGPPRDQRVNINVMAAELKRTLAWVQEGKLQEMACYQTVPEELLQLREVALSGDGEPTLCPNFAEIVQALVHLRAQAQFPFFRIVLITNGTGLHLPTVQRGLRWFTARDEIWAKLDAGSQGYLEKVNRTNLSLDKILANLLQIGRQRPIVVQSLFCQLQDKEPPPKEIEHYVHRLAELKAGGAAISLVQIYSAHRPTALSECRHLSLHCLSRIAQQVREEAGLEAEVF
ncbi:MAG: radical SAM protein [Candidatus Omnitrophica bacterium]|nr:radical SAM protein [Candidatus Omnitrophota bacterium]